MRGELLQPAVLRSVQTSPQRCGARKTRRRFWLCVVPLRRLLKCADSACTRAHGWQVLQTIACAVRPNVAGDGRVPALSVGAARHHGDELMAAGAPSDYEAFGDETSASKTAPCLVTADTELAAIWSGTCTYSHRMSWGVRAPAGAAACDGAGRRVKRSRIEFLLGADAVVGQVCAPRRRAACGRRSRRRAAGGAALPACGGGGHDEGGSRRLAVRDKLQGGAHRVTTHAACGSKPTSFRAVYGVYGVHVLRIHNTRRIPVAARSALRSARLHDESRCGGVHCTQAACTSALCGCGLCACQRRQRRGPLGPKRRPSTGPGARTVCG